jgi:DNA-directed RNA polymerase specialized sigma24 family protein
MIAADVLQEIRLPLFNLACRLGAEEDVVQETLLRVWLKADDRRTTSEILAYGCKILRRLVAEGRQAAQPDALTNDIPVHDGFAADSAGPARAARLLRLMSQFERIA